MEPWKLIAVAAYIAGGACLIYRVGVWRQDREARTEISHLVQMRIVTRRRWWPFAFRERAKVAALRAHYCRGVGATLAATDAAPDARNLDYVAVSSVSGLGRWAEALRPDGFLFMRGRKGDFDAVLAAVAASGLKIALAARETDRRNEFVVVARKV